MITSKDFMSLRIRHKHSFVGFLFSMNNEGSHDGGGGIFPSIPPRIPPPGMLETFPLLLLPLEGRTGGLLGGAPAAVPEFPFQLFPSSSEEAVDVSPGISS